MADSIDIKTFYDEHPINCSEILEKARAAGVDTDNPSAQDLWAFDQDHYGGLDAVRALGDALTLDRSNHVLDICCGLGGPARFIATTYGCKVHGVDLNQSRIDGAETLTALTGLDKQIEYTCADACELPFADGAFDRLMSQEAFLHIENREALLSQCRRVLQATGQFAFTDWIASDTLSAEHRNRFATTFAASRICTVAEYHELLRAAGFQVNEAVDLSSDWQRILVERLKMFKSLEAQTVARFGRDRHNTYISNYEFFVARIGAGDLGGARFVASAG
jgi:cyclopropane fatty-acyl-phospholipid synthase-like methyltransferase